MVVVPGRPPNLGNLRLGWADRHRLVANRKALVRTLARSALARAPVAPAATPCLVKATVFLAGAQFDTDNWASMRADSDGLVAAGALRNDSPAWCRLELEQVRALRREQRVGYRVSPLLRAVPAGRGRGQPSPGKEVVLQHAGSGRGHRTGERNVPAGAERRCPACGAPLPPRIPGPAAGRRADCSRSCRSPAPLRQSRGLPVELPNQPPSGCRRLGAPRR